MARDRATRARHLAREQLVKALYQWQIAGHSVAEIRSQFSTAEDFERCDRDYFAELLSAIVDDATAYGEGLGNEVEKTLTAAGVKVLPREKGTKDTRDWKAVLTKVKGKKPDAVFYGGMDATAGPLLKQGRELGIKVVFAFGDGACTNTMKDLAGDAAEGFVCSQAGIPVQAASAKFLADYKAKFNAEPIQYSPFTYDSTHILIAAMQKANSADPAKYLPELAKISHDGASGKIEFDEKGDLKGGAITMYQVKGGKWQPLETLGATASAAH